MFYGIIIRMYCSPGEHNPPHIHAYYQDSMAIVDVNSGEVSEGKLPPRQTKLVLAWTEIHRDELIADWELASKGELPFPIEPLK
ncbi:MAG: DUF4160 domain-containing protein [Candidatus Aquicultorales bacterium]